MPTDGLHHAVMQTGAGARVQRQNHGELASVDGDKNTTNNDGQPNEGFALWAGGLVFRNYCHAHYTTNIGQ